ncbi:MAG: hypothetical protein IJS78_07205 [Clostridia bacterium]|nr:hypothetical protein [Clostridia bacterium]
MKKAIAFLLLPILVLGIAACSAKEARAPESDIGVTDGPRPDHAFTEKVAPADEALEWAKNKGTVVVSDESVFSFSGAETWEEFMAKTEKGEPASVLIARYKSNAVYSSSAANVRRSLTFCLLEYDGEYYAATVRDSEEPAAGPAAVYRNLFLVVPDVAAPGIAAERFVLSSDDAIHWGDTSSYPIVKDLFILFTRIEKAL